MLKIGTAAILERGTQVILPSNTGPGTTLCRGNQDCPIHRSIDKIDCTSQARSLNCLCQDATGIRWRSTVSVVPRHRLILNSTLLPPPSALILRLDSSSLPRHTHRIENYYLGPINNGLLAFQDICISDHSYPDIEVAQEWSA